MGDQLSKEVLVFLVLAILAVGYVVMDANKRIPMPNPGPNSDLAGEAYCKAQKKALISDELWISVGENALTITPYCAHYTIKLFEVKPITSEAGATDVVVFTVNKKLYQLPLHEKLVFEDMILEFSDLKELHSETQDIEAAFLEYVYSK